MNYCLLGIINEVLSKERFYLYMINLVLKPLDIIGSFNIYEKPNEVLEQLGTIY